ncbi:MAG: hypothetical protein K0R72_1093 [Clostridia bacterium]|jgi:hypothetical protein|nr:hypothetical protein [Clostridia bacterium]
MKIRKERVHSTKIKNILKNYFSFYNKNLKKKHIIVYIISLIIFAFFMVNFINNLNEVNQFLSEVNNIGKNPNIFMTIIKDKIPLVVLLIFSGVTPYVYIPVIGIIGFPYLLTMNIMNMSTLNMIIACIGGLVQIFGVSLAVAAGIYYCTSSTKRIRYNQSNALGLDDVKKQIYEATKKEEKLNELNDKMQAKREKREKLNVKIEYKALILTGIISIIIVSVAALFTGV